MSSIRDNPEYIFKENERELERLRKQHAWFQRCHNNKLIFAPVDLQKPGLNILDVGCADGTLLRDLRKQVDPSARLVGLDITEEFFPTSDEDDIVYQRYDAAERPEMESREAFDLTHVRLLLAGVTRVNYSVTISNLASTLAPGGWLQVQEMDLDPDRPGMTPAVRDYHILLNAMFEKAGMDPKYAIKSKAAFEASGLQNVVTQEKLLPIGKPLGDVTVARQSLEASLLTIPTVLNAAKAMKVDLPEAVTDQLMERFEKEAMEVGATLKYLVITGQKAS